MTEITPDQMAEFVKLVRGNEKKFRNRSITHELVRRVTDCPSYAVASQICQHLLASGEFLAIPGKEGQYRLATTSPPLSDGPSKTDLTETKGVPETPSQKISSGSPDVQEIALAQVMERQDLQPRTQINEEAVERYVEHLQSGGAFPPLLVISCEDEVLLVDGFHRLAAYRRHQVERIQVEFVQGTLWEARLRAMKANLRHGVPLTLQDRKRALMTFLNGNPDYRTKATYSEMARDFGLSDKTCKALAEEVSSGRSEPRKPVYTRKDGSTRSTGTRAPKTSTSADGEKMKRSEADSIPTEPQPDAVPNQERLFEAIQRTLLEAETQDNTQDTRVESNAIDVAELERLIQSLGQLTPERLSPLRARAELDTVLRALESAVESVAQAMAATRSDRPLIPMKPRDEA